MFVCICHGVTDRDIRNAAADGVCSLDGLGEELKVGTCCGRCSDCASQILHETAAAGVEIPQPVVAIA